MSIKDEINESEAILSMVWTLPVWKVDELFAEILSNFDKRLNESLVLTDAIFDPSTYILGM